MRHLDTRVGCVLIASLLLVARPGNSQTFGILKEFVEGGEVPSRASLLQASDGALYGTISRGGGFGLGAIFKISADGSSFSTVYSFDGLRGAIPVAGLVQGSDALYGTTAQGGGAWGHGTVFKMSLDGSMFSVLHAFDGADGSSPPSPAWSWVPTGPFMGRRTTVAHSTPGRSSGSRSMERLSRSSTAFSGPTENTR